MVGRLPKVINVLIEKGRLPAEWKKTIIVSIFKKKGSKVECVNYWGIS